MAAWSFRKRPSQQEQTRKTAKQELEDFLSRANFDNPAPGDIYHEEYLRQRAQEEENPPKD